MTLGFNQDESPLLVLPAMHHIITVDWFSAHLGITR